MKDLYYNGEMIDPTIFVSKLKDKKEYGTDIWFCTECKEFKNDDDVVSCKDDMYLLCEECGRDSEVEWEEYDPKLFHWEEKK